MRERRHRERKKGEQKQTKTIIKGREVVRQKRIREGEGREREREREEEEEEEEQKQRDEGGEVVRQTMREAEGRRSIPAYY